MGLPKKDWDPERKARTQKADQSIMYEQITLGGHLLYVRSYTESEFQLKYEKNSRERLRSDLGCIG